MFYKLFVLIFSSKFQVAKPIFGKCLLSKYPSGIWCLILSYKAKQYIGSRNSTSQISGKIEHNSPIRDECEAQSAKALALPFAQQAHQDDSTIRYPNVRFESGSFYYGLEKPWKSLILSKGKPTWYSHKVVECFWNRLYKPIACHGMVGNLG